MIYLLYIFALMFTLCAALTDFTQYRLCYSGFVYSSNKRSMLNKRWHITQWFERFFLLFTGLLCYLFPEHILMIAVLFWILNDGLKNIWKKNKFFTINKSSGDPIKYLATWYVKLIVFLIALNIILFWNNIL